MGRGAITKADIERDVASMNVQDEHRPVMIALSEFQAGLPLDQTCPVCESAIAVEGLKTGTPFYNVWITSCGCGKCNDTFKGL